MKLIKRKPWLYLLTSSAIALSLYQATVVQAEEVTPATEVNVSQSTEETVIQLTFGEDNKTTSSELKTTEQPTPPATTEPTITHIEVVGGVDETATGVAAFNGVEIKLTGEHLTDDNFLTADGLRWSEHTQVELIQGEVVGNINSDAYWTRNNPIEVVQTYSMNVGDKGRITRVGTTKSGIDLDLIWTVTATDKETWTHPGYSIPPIGVAFTGEQNIRGTKGDSIVVYYNGANMLGMHYQIVKHQTLEEVPVIVSFIATDIDTAQGAQTNVDNLARIIPNNSNLREHNGIIYDATPTMYGANHNGAVDLPNGGYLGAGFISNFHYNFFAPAPVRETATYQNATGVRYDLFGSALQAHLSTAVRQSITVNYLDEQGNELQAPTYYLGLSNETYPFHVPPIEGYTYSRFTQQTPQANRPVVTIIYQRQPRVTLKFVDDEGVVLTTPQQFSIKRGDIFTFNPTVITGYETPRALNQLIVGDTTHIFVYHRQLPLTLNYVDTEGNVLLPSETYHVKRGQTVRYPAPYLTGYVLPKDFQTTVEQAESHTFTYTKLFDVSLELLDSETRKVLDTRTVQVKKDETLRYPLPVIKGYTSAGEIILTAEQNRTEDVEYRRLYHVVLRYVDTKGNVLQRDRHYVRPSQAIFQQIAPTIDGYVAPSIFETTVDRDITHEFVYRKQHQVTLQYVDHQGKTLSDAQTVIVTEGDTLTQPSRVINGYQTPSTLTATIQGDFTHQYIYHRLPSSGLTGVERLPEVKPVTPQPPRLEIIYNPRTQQVVPTNQVTPNVRRAYVDLPLQWTFNEANKIYQAKDYGKVKRPIPSHNALHSLYPTVVANYARNKSVPKEWLTMPTYVGNPIANFTKNTGFSLKDQITLHKGLQEMRQISLKDKINPDYIQAISLAHVAYKSDAAQAQFNPLYWNVLNKFNSLEVSTLMAATYNDVEHPKYKIDIPHFMVGYASYLEIPSTWNSVLGATTYEVSRSVFSFRLPVGIGVTTGLKLLGYEKFVEINRKAPPHERRIRLQVNSLAGDLASNMNDKDLFTDLDLLILTTHPAYKDLPLDKKLYMYYNQPNVADKRMKMLYDSYSLTSAEEAKALLVMEMYLALETVGGIALWVLFGGEKQRENVNRLKQLMDEEDNRRKYEQQTNRNRVVNVINSVKNTILNWVAPKKIPTKTPKRPIVQQYGGDSHARWAQERDGVKKQPKKTQPSKPRKKKGR